MNFEKILRVAIAIAGGVLAFQFGRRLVSGIRIS